MEWLGMAGLFGMGVGAIIGRMGEARIWRLKANPDYRTAMCSGGEFFYVMPEKEYVDKHLKLNER